MNHTLREWKIYNTIDLHGNHMRHIGTQHISGSHIVICDIPASKDTDEIARLIASAPDLLEVLKSTETLLCSIRQCIAKVEAK